MCALIAMTRTRGLSGIGSKDSALILNLSTPKKRKMYSTAGKQNTGHHRRNVMARSSYQRGCLQWHQGQWTLLYRVREAGKMVQKREVEAFKQFTDRNDKKAAKRAAEPFMEQINARNNNPKFAVSDSVITFAQFIETRWASYV